MADITIKDVVVSNKSHGREDVTCRGTLASPEHKLSEKANKSYVDQKLTEVKAIDNLGDSIPTQQPTCYPTIDELGTLVKYENNSYIAAPKDELDIDYSKLTPGVISYTDLLNLFNETDYIVKEDKAQDFFWTENCYYADGAGLVIPAYTTAFTFYLFDFNEIITDCSLVVSQIEITYKLQEETASISFIADTITGDEETYEVEAESYKQTSTFTTTHGGFRNLYLYGNDNYGIVITELKLTLVAKESTTSEDEQCYVYKKLDITTDDLLEASASTRTKFYRNTIDESVNYTQKDDPVNEFVKITSEDEFIDGAEYLIVAKDYNYALGNSTGQVSKTDLYEVEKDGDKITTDIENLVKIDFTITYDETNQFYRVQNKYGWYIGKKDGKNGIESINDPTTADKLLRIKNLLSFNDDGTVNLTANNTGNLNFNQQGTMQFGYYKSAQQPINLYRYVHKDGYNWKVVAKKDEISKVGFSNDYDDLDNLPLTGDVVANDYTELPTPSHDYDKILSRYNDEIYTLISGDGWNFNPIRFSNTYTKVTGTTLNPYFNYYLHEQDWAFFHDYDFDTENALVQNTQGIGIQIGTSSNPGYLNITFPSEGTNYYAFKSVTLGFKQWNYDVGKVDIKIGLNSSTIYKTDSVYFTSETHTDDEVFITLTSLDDCKYISIATDGEVGRRLILTTFNFNDLKNVDTYETTVITPIKKRIQWKNLCENNLLTKITHGELVQLRNNSGLTPGMQYRITDYECFSNYGGCFSTFAKHRFDIIVTADNEYTLNENARACRSDNDIEYTIYINGIGNAKYSKDLLIDNGKYYHIYGNEETAKSEYGDNFIGWALTDEDGEPIDKPTGSFIMNGVYFDSDDDLFKLGSEETGNSIVNTYSYFENVDFTPWELKYTLTNERMTVEENTNRYLWYCDNGIIIIDTGATENYMKQYAFSRYRSDDMEVNGVQYYAWYNDEYGTLWTTTETPEINTAVYNQEWDSSTQSNKMVANYKVINTVKNNKGVIYYMKDELNNECPYDFKNILFKRYKITATSRSELEDLVENYYSVYSNRDYFTVSSNDIILCYTFNLSRTYSLDSTIKCYDEDYFDDYHYVYNNKFNNRVDGWYNTSYLLNCVMFGGYNYNNIFGYYNDDNTFGEGCQNNNSKNYFSSNIFHNSCYYNTFGNYFYYNTFGSSCRRNTFGNDCYHNTFGNDYYKNTFGNDCNYNTFGYEFRYCKFGNDCYNNTFGNDINNNTFGNDCYYNTFGNYCNGNTFGNNCSNNRFGTITKTYNGSTYTWAGNELVTNLSGVQVWVSKWSNGTNTYYSRDDSDSYQRKLWYNKQYAASGRWQYYYNCTVNKTAKSYVRYITFEDGVSCIAINPTSTTSDSQYYQNVTAHKGISTGTAIKIVTDSNVNQQYGTDIKTNNDIIINI